jgi:para-nitrobenzyl esterase
MTATISRRALFTLFCVVVTALTPVPAAGARADLRPSVPPIATTDAGAVRGAIVAGGLAFRGVPYAAAPTGDLRWRAPRAPAGWQGIRDATEYAASCPQQPSPSAGPGPFAEDCLYLNVHTPTLRRGADRPVIVWIHGGGFAEDASRNYDASKLAAEGTVVVTFNYRLGALGFLAHPALASRPGGPSGNYGLMDQQAALRWVRRNIEQFGGDRHNVTIAGQSAGGLAVLAHLVSRGSRGLFERAIVQSGAFALTQQPLAGAEAFGESVAAAVGCPDQTAQCLRQVPVDDLVGTFPTAAIPGVVDGRVLRRSIGTALAAGRFARVPVLNGISHDEEVIFTDGVGLAVSGGSFVRVPERMVTEAGYQGDIAAVLGVSAQRAAAIAAEYPPAAYASPDVAFSLLVSDANFACPALEVDRWTSGRVPTFAYQFDDDNAPQRFAAPGALPALATHSAELQYLFDQPNTPVPGTLSADQQALAASMRAAWASFAADGNPSTPALRWPAITHGERVMSLVPPQPRLVAGFEATHHCAFWAAG